MKTTIAALAFLVMAPSGALAQRLNIDHLDRLAERAEEAVNVTVTPEMLKFFAGLIPSKDADSAAVKQFVTGLKGIYVRNFEFGREKGYTAEDIATIRKQLTGPNWARMVTVDKPKDSETVDVYMWMDGDRMGGLAVLVAELSKLTVVNIVGPMDIEKLMELQGQFGIPELPKIETPPADKKP